MTSVLGVFSALLAIFVRFNPAYSTGRVVFETLKVLAGLAGAIGALMQVRGAVREPRTLGLWCY